MLKGSFEKSLPILVQIVVLVSKRILFVRTSGNYDLSVWALTKDIEQLGVRLR
jgi:hypothetical protein